MRVGERLMNAVSTPHAGYGGMEEPAFAIRVYLEESTVACRDPHAAAFHGIETCGMVGAEGKRIEAAR